MAMVGVDSGSLNADSQSQVKSFGLVLGRWPLGAVLHSSNEPGELSQWLCHDDSTINIVLDIIIINSIIYSLFFVGRNNIQCCVEEIHSVGMISSVETSYFTQLKMCYLMTTFRCLSDILITTDIKTLSLGNTFSVV